MVLLSTRRRGRARVKSTATTSSHSNCETSNPTEALETMAASSPLSPPPPYPASPPRRPQRFTRRQSLHRCCWIKGSLTMMISLGMATLLLHSLLQPVAATKKDLMEWGDPEEDISSSDAPPPTIHCLSSHHKQMQSQGKPLTLQECHPLMANVDEATGSVCVEVVPDPERPWDPALQLSFLALTTENTSSNQWLFLEHHVWIGNSVWDVPRHDTTGQLDTSQFAASWTNYSDGGTEWQTQVSLDCENKQTHSFLVLTASVATTNLQDELAQQQCFAMEFDGQGGAGWYGWMEILVDCQCTIEVDEEDAEDSQEEPSLHAEALDDFFPYGTACQGPDLFRLLDSPEEGHHCWDILDRVLQTPMSRLCVDIDNQDMEETELTVTFSPLEYSELVQTSFWAGIHPGDTIHAVPKDAVTQKLDLQHFDQYFNDPKGLPNIVFEFRLPTDICSIPHPSGGDMAMDHEGILAIPLVAHAKTKTKFPQGETYREAALEEGFAAEYRFVNDQVEFGWMELNLQCGCARSHKNEALRRGTPPNGEEDEDDVHDSVELDVLPAPPKKPRAPICRSAFAYSATQQGDLARPLENFGYDLFGYTNGPFESSYSYITLDLMSTEVFVQDEKGYDREVEVEPQKVGSVKVFYDGEDATVSFSLEETFPLQSTQLWVGKTPLPMHKKAPKAQTAAALFEFRHQHNEQEIPNPYQDTYVVEGFDFGDKIYIMAVASDCTDTLLLGRDDEDEDNSTEDKGAVDAPATKACIRSYSDCYPLTAHNDGDKIKGDVCFSLDKEQENLNVRYTLHDDADLVFSEAQVWVGPTLKDMPTHRDKSPDLADFKYHKVWAADKMSSTWSTQIPIERREHCGGTKHGDYDLVVVAHALVGKHCEGHCDSPALPETEQHVYGEESLLQKRDKWFYYIDLQIECDCQDDEVGHSVPTASPTAYPTIDPTVSPTITPSPSSPDKTDTPTAMPTEQIDMKNTCIYTADSSGEYCLLLYAPHAWETSAGSVCLTMVDGELVVMYDIVSYWALTEVNIWVGHDMLNVPTNDEYEPDPQAFPIKHKYPKGTDHFTEVVTMDQVTQDLCHKTGAYDLYVFAHGLVAEPAVTPTEAQPFVPLTEEDSWAKAHHFSKDSSAYYVLASVICDCEAYYGPSDKGEDKDKDSRSLQELNDLKLPASPTFPSSIDAGYKNAPSQSPSMVHSDSDAGDDPDTQGFSVPSTVPQMEGVVCQSAWAVDTSADSLCHPRIDHPKFTYGWSHGPLRLQEGVVVLDLYLETKDCSRFGVNVGTVWISWDEDRNRVAVDFKMDADGFYMTETNVYFAEKPLYSSPSYQSMVSPQDYPLFHTNLTKAATMEDTHTVPLASNGVDSLFAQLQYVSAHATICSELPVAQAKMKMPVMAPANAMRGSSSATTMQV